MDAVSSSSVHIQNKELTGVGVNLAALYAMSDRAGANHSLNDVRVADTDTDVLRTDVLRTSTTSQSIGESAPLETG